MGIQTRSSSVKNREVQRCCCQACRHTFQTLRKGKNPSLKGQTPELYLEGHCSEPLAESLGGITKQFPTDLSRPLSSFKLLNPRRRTAPSFRSMNYVTLSVKKSKCWIWITIDSTLCKVLDFVCGSRSIKTTRDLYK